MSSTTLEKAPPGTTVGNQPPKGHPKALYTLFLAEMWERFSYYGMRALLLLYMIRELAYGDGRAIGVYSAYTALVYTTPFIGGILADRFLGNRKAVIFGGITMALGQFLLAVNNPFIVPQAIFDGGFLFFLGLSFLIVGNGFFKPNISSIVGALYEQGDPRRDSGFTIFYMGINLGAFLAPLICGFVGETFGWSYGFLLAGLGMLLGQVIFNRGQKNMMGKGLPPDPAKLKAKSALGLSTEMLIYTLAILTIPVFAYMVNITAITTWVLYGGGAIVLGILIATAMKETKVNRERIFVILILIFFSTVFWSFFEQAGTSINLFTARNVDRGGIPTSLFQSVNPFFIIALGPVFAALWVWMRRRNLEPSTPLKFVLGILQLGLGFGALVMGAQSADASGQVALAWLVLGYFLHTTGELCLSPVGLSMVTKLAPGKIVAMAMGAWFLSSAFAQNVAGLIAQETDTSSYMVENVAYTAKPDFAGKDDVKLLVYDVKERPGQAADAKNKVMDTTFSQPFTASFIVGAEKTSEEASMAGKPFNIYSSTQPGQNDTVNLRLNYFDPTGELTNIAITKQPVNGKAEVKGDEVVYTPNAGFTGKDVLTYTMCEKEDAKKCQEVILTFTVDNEKNHAPVALTNQVEQTLVKPTTFKKSEASVNVLNHFYDPDGDPLHIKLLTEKPAGGYVKVDNDLHSFVTADKTKHIYSGVFQFIFMVSMGVTVVLFLLVPLLKKWMHGVN